MWGVYTFTVGYMGSMMNANDGTASNCGRHSLTASIVFHLVGIIW